MNGAAAQHNVGVVPGIGRRFFRHRLAMCSAALLVLMIVATVASLPWTIRWHDVHSLEHAVRHPPAANPVVLFDPYAAELPGNTANSNASRAFSCAASWLGHDDLGRSLLFRLLPGFLISLLIGLTAAGVAVVIGTAWGAIAGLAGGRLDLVMMRVVDVLYGLPYILLVIVLQVGLVKPLRAFFGGPSPIADLAVLLVAISGVSWLTMARVVRGQVLSLRTQPFVDAARVAGAGPRHILRRHILPNLTGPIAVYATLIVPQAILQESFLSFLGIGIRAPTPSLGRLAADGVEAVNAYVEFWWLLFFPCAVLTITLLALNFLGDALRDALDPRSTAAPVA